MKLETLEFAGLYSVLNALHLPYGQGAHKETISVVNGFVKDRFVSTNTSLVIGEHDINLIKTLRKRGDEHAKVLRGLIVWAEITAPLYWWSEMETYTIGHQRLASESTMHSEGRGLSGEELQKVKSAIPSGRELTKIDYFSYQTLTRIYAQRHNHRLPEWHKFCDWVETLPFFEEFIKPELQTKKHDTENEKNADN